MKADLEEQLLALITSLNESPFSNIEIVQEATSILKESRQLYSNGGAFVSAILARNETMEERHRDDQKKIKSLEEKLQLLEHEQRGELCFLACVNFFFKYLLCLQWKKTNK